MAAGDETTLTPEKAAAMLGMPVDENDARSRAYTDDLEDALTPEPIVLESPVVPALAPGKQWYVLKVQSNREDSIRDSILRRVKIAGLDAFVGEVFVPTEKISEIKGGKKRVMERKFYPGYIMAQFEMNDDLWFTIRETPGVGDFLGSGGKPMPMSENDIARMLGRKKEDETPKLKVNFVKGDRVKIKEGSFVNFEGEVEELNEVKGLVKVMIQVFGRPTPVTLEYWQVEPV